MNDAALLDSLHAALRNPDLAWYTEFHAGESIVAGYLDSLTDPYDDDAIQVPEGWFRYSVVTREGDHALPWMEHWNEYEYSITHHIDWNGKGFTPYDLYCTQDLTGMIARRQLFPCWFGSALKLEGVEELLSGLERYAPAPDYPKEFAARGRPDRPHGTKPVRTL